MTGRGVTRRGAIAGALLVGGLLGVMDGLFVLIENPRSFAGLASPAAFLGGAIAMGLLAGGLAGLVLAAPGRRPRAGLVVGGGGALAAFFALGVRMHVKWFFGEPLSAPANLLANNALAALCAGGAALVWRVVGAGLARRLGRPAFLIALLAVGVVSTVAALGLRDGPPGAVARGTPSSGARDVLLLTLDTTRADHLSVYGYPRGTTPAIDRLARSGRLWESAFAPIPLTNPSHTSILTGQLPREHGVLNNGTALDPSIPTLVPDLAQAGWRCAAFVSGIPLKSGLSGLAPGFEVYDDTLSPLERVHPMLTSLALVRVANRVLPGDLVERRADATVAAAMRWLERTPGPRFLWVHLFDPHTPYDAPEILHRRFERESPAWTAGGRPVTGWPHADYDAELRASDRAIEDLLRTWDEVTNGEGRVILTADHGEGLEQHGELTHGAQLFQEDVHVPYIRRGDEADGEANTVGRGYRSITEIPVELVQLAGRAGPADLVDRESIAGRPDLERPANGRSVDPASSAEAPFLLIETFAPEGRRDQSALLALDGRKILVDRETGETRCFDLAVDPGEQRPLAGMGDRWDTLRESLATRATGSPEELDPETLRRLRSLGYLH